MTSGATSGHRGRLDDGQPLTQLLEKWHAIHRRGLEVRHEIGALLNSRLGPPTKRQLRGIHVMEKVAEVLGVSMSELSQFRWLNCLFGNITELQKTYPACRTWTEFKDLLPSLKLPGGQTNGRRKQASLRSE
jgi:hypothetical protein